MARGRWVLVTQAHCDYYAEAAALATEWRLKYGPGHVVRARHQANPGRYVVCVYRR